MLEFLSSTKIIESDADEIVSLASSLAVRGNSTETAKRCFEWVRDNITHSFDADAEIVTCAATAVLRERTGICYAKTHLLAALLRANAIPAGFGYQRIALDDGASQFCLHGFNYVYLEEFGWYAVDPRGNREGIATSFDPPKVTLAFVTNLPGEKTYDEIFPEPLPMVIESLMANSTVSELQAALPDWDE
ncbi:MAG: transglutaminase family protein [Acidobacteria bacterium]|nr:transglutaminase family protein [Acidobacteriota bacterium]